MTSIMKKSLESLSKVIFRLTVIAVLACLYAACGTSGMTRPDSDVDWIEEELPVGSLQFEPDSDTQLSQRERGEVKGYYLDTGGNPATTTVTLSLLGSAYDTTLETTEVETDEDNPGYFTAKIIAGSVDTDFTLRAVAADGARAEINIQIVSSGRGVIKIEPVPEGRRKIDSFIVHLHESAGCPAGVAEPRFESPPVQAPIVFSHLPEQVTFTVAVYGYACDDDVLTDECFLWVEGCMENVQPLSGTAPAIDIPVHDDIDYFSQEAFSTNTILDAEEILAGHVEKFLESLNPIAVSVEGIASLLLDNIQNKFDSPDDDVFINARAAGDMDRRVAELLQAPGPWNPSEEIDTLSSLLFTSTSTLTFRGRLEKNFWPENPGERFLAKHVFESIAAGGHNLIEQVLDEGIRESQTMVSYNYDIATLGAHTFPVGAGSLILAIFTHVYIPSIVTGVDHDSDATRQWMESHIECEAIGELLASNEDMASLAIPDDPVEYYSAECSDILDAIAREVRLAAEGIDSLLPIIELAGSADFLESDGTPHAGKIARGAWNDIKWGSENLSSPQPFTLEPSESLE